MVQEDLFRRAGFRNDFGEIHSSRAVAVHLVAVEACVVVLGASHLGHKLILLARGRAAHLVPRAALEFLQKNVHAARTSSIVCGVMCPIGQPWAESGQETRRGRACAVGSDWWELAGVVRSSGADVCRLQWTTGLPRLWSRDRSSANGMTGCGASGELEVRLLSSRLSKPLGRCLPHGSE